VKATSIKDLKAREPTKPETDQKFEFTCVVDDSHANEHFDAKCIFEKKFPITRSRKDKRIALAHIYIIAVSDQEWNDLTDLRFITNKAIADAWGKKPTYKAHGHFILFNIDGMANIFDGTGAATRWSLACARRRTWGRPLTRTSHESWWISQGDVRLPSLGCWILFTRAYLRPSACFCPDEEAIQVVLDECGTTSQHVALNPANVEGGYNDTSVCHCILFDEDGDVTRDRAELGIRQEFDKAVQALADGDRPLAAFYAGALAHYMGDLGQFYHIMCSQSHWGSEDQSRHSAYEVAVESTIRFQNRTSTVFESFISPIAVGGDSSEEIARTVALRVEKGTGTSGRTPGFMDERFAELIGAGDHLTPEDWDDGFRAQTGQNINVAANGIVRSCCG
jgi:hypothetical protein